MKRIILIVTLLLGVLGAWFYFSRSSEVVTTTDTATSTYAYRCGDGSEFYVDIAGDLSFLRIYPATSVDYVPDVILEQVSSDIGTRFEGSGFVFEGRGEVMQLSSEHGETSCSPIFSPDEAPFNFGE